MRAWIFNHLAYEFSSSFSTIYGIIFPASKMWITGCVFQPEIEWKIYPLKIELTVYISCSKECFLQEISQIYFIPQQAEFHLLAVWELSYPSLPSCNHWPFTWHIHPAQSLGYISTWHFNFMCNINQGLTYSHAHCGPPCGRNSYHNSPLLYM